MGGGEEMGKRQTDRQTERWGSGGSILGNCGRVNVLSMKLEKMKAKYDRPAFSSMLDNR